MISETLGQIFDFISEKNIVEEDCYNCQGEYPLYTGQTEKEGIMAFIDTYDIDGECLTFTTYGAAGELNYRIGKFTIGRNCMGLRPKDKYLKMINLKWFAYKFQNLFWRIRIGDISGQRSLNKLLLNDIVVKIPNIETQLYELSSYEKANTLEVKLIEIKDLISNMNNYKVESLEILYEETVGKLFKLNGGNSGLTEVFIYQNQPECIEEAIPILSGSTVESKKMGYVSRHTVLPSEKVIKTFKGEGIIISRNGNAGKMEIIEKYVSRSIL